MITLPDGKICNNLPEQVAKNAKDILEIAAQWQPYKDQLEADFEILAGLIEDMSSAAVAALVGQDVVVKTIKQTSPNWSVDLSDIVLNVSGTFTATNIFSRLQVVNQELEVIFTFSVTNTGASTATPSNVQLGIFDIPEEYAAKIYDVMGNPLTTNNSLIAIAGARMVNSITAPASSTVFQQQYGILNLSHSGKNKLFIGAYQFQGIGAGDTHTYSGRIQLTLL